MAINFMFGDGNEYQAEAEAAMRQQRGQSSQGGGSPSPIATVLDLLGIGRQVARPPKGESNDTGDLASTSEAPTTQQTAVTDKKGNVIDVVEETLSQLGQSTNVQRLPLAPLELNPLTMLSGQGVPIPGSMQRIDPTTGLLR